MPLCRSCGTDNAADRDFCSSCGEYMRWDPTGFQAAVPEAPAAPAPPPAAVPPAPGAVPAPPAPGAPPPPAVPAGPYQQQAPPPPPAIPEQPPQQPESVLVALRLPTDDGYAGEMPSPGVEPGGQTALIALVRNQSGIVDNYDMVVEGLPEGWWTIDPGTVYLVPYGSGGGSYEQEVQIALHPPRAAEAEARTWDIRIVARSRAYGAEAGGAQATLAIAPYQDIDASLSPERRAGRLRADYKVAVANKSNSAVDVTFSGMDAESACAFTFHELPGPKRPPKVDAQGAARAVRQAQYLGVGHGAAGAEQMANRMMMQFQQGNVGPLVRLFRGRNLPPQIGGLHLEPGEKAECIASVSPPKQIWLGRPAFHSFQVVVQPTGTDQPGRPVSGVFRHKPWLPWWLIIVIPLLVLLAIWLLSMRTETVKVPNVVGAKDLVEATATLEKAGLTVGEKGTVESADKAPGSVVSQDPAADAEVDKGSAVSLRTAVGATEAAVPDLTGKTVAEAQALIQAANFTFQPPADLKDPATQTIASQLPPGGVTAKVGTPIQVFLAQPQTNTDTTGSTSTGGQPAPPPPGPSPSPAPVPPGGGGGGGGDLTVPNLVGLTSDKAVAALVAKKLLAVPTSEFSPSVPSGTVISQNPAAGAAAKENQQIAIVVSKGFPAILMNLNNNIVSVGGGSGQPIKKIAATPDVEEEPSVTPDGAVVVYVRHAKLGDNLGQLFTVKVADPNSAAALTTPGADDGRPAVSPDGKVVAFVSNRTDPKNSDLCFIRLDQTGAQPDCVLDPGTSVTRPAWSPDGRSIVVVASDANQGAVGQTELLLYTSQTPSSSRAADWLKQGLVTDAMHGQEKGDQVGQAAFKPDGTELAFTANWSGGSKIFVSKVENGVISPAKPKAIPKVSACELAWRADGKELAIAVRDEACQQAGRIYRVDPATPETQTALTGVNSSAGNPVWFPVVTGG